MVLISDWLYQNFQRSVCCTFWSFEKMYSKGKTVDRQTRCTGVYSSHRICQSTGFGRLQPDCNNWTDVAKSTGCVRGWILRQLINPL